MESALGPPCKHRAAGTRSCLVPHQQAACPCLSRERVVQQQPGCVKRLIASSAMSKRRGANLQYSECNLIWEQGPGRCS